MVSVEPGDLRRDSDADFRVALAEDGRETAFEPGKILARSDIRGRLRAANHRRDLSVSGRPQHDDEACASPPDRTDDGRLVPLYLIRQFRRRYGRRLLRGRIARGAGWVIQQIGGGPDYCGSGSFSVDSAHQNADGKGSLKDR